MATHTRKCDNIKKKMNFNKREFVTAEDGESYAIIKSGKGDFRFNVEIIRTGKEIISRARGSLIKGPGKQRLQGGDIVLIQEGDPSYILTKYSDEEVKKLTIMGELVSFKPKVVGDDIVLCEGDDDKSDTQELKIDEI
jgi:hypothetical protein